MQNRFIPNGTTKPNETKQKIRATRRKRHDDVINLKMGNTWTGRHENARMCKVYSRSGCCCFQSFWGRTRINCHIAQWASAQQTHQIKLMHRSKDTRRKLNNLFWFVVVVAVLFCGPYVTLSHSKWNLHLEIVYATRTKLMRCDRIILRSRFVWSVSLCVCVCQNRLAKWMRIKKWPMAEKKLLLLILWQQQTLTKWAQMAREREVGREREMAYAKDDRLI